MRFQKYGHQDDNSEVKKVLKAEETEAASKEDARNRWFVEEQERVVKPAAEEAYEDGGEDNS